MLKRDPPTSEADYDDAPASKLRTSQGPVKPGKTAGVESTVKKLSHGVGDEPLHDAEATVMTKAMKALRSHSDGGIHKVGP